LPGLACRNGEQNGQAPKQLFGVALDKGNDALDIGGSFEDVDLVENYDDLLAPLPDALQEGALALAEGPVRRRDE
jgi:hypothetical protein